MNHTDDLELLRQFSNTRSEEIFSRLVHRYAPLVYSVGLRVSGSPEAARDIAQRVFIDLCQRLPKVLTALERAGSTPETAASLSAWLHRAARYEALEYIRSENRRQARERIAMELHARSAPNDWPSIRPMLDEALDSLEEPDRQAVLIRFFEEASLRDLGARCGISEDAAQKRVSRALDRMREILLRKGLTTSVATLAAGLTAGAIEAPPVGLESSITLATVRTAVPPTSTASSFFPDRFPPIRLLLPIGGAITLLLTFLFFFAPSSELDQNTAASPPAAEQRAEPANFSNDSVSAAIPLPQALSLNSSSSLVLRVVAEDTGQPLQHVLGSVGCTRDGIRASSLPSFNTDANGQATVHFTNDIFGLSIELFLEGFASTRVAWKPGRGQTIPSEYTLRMATAPLIGGFVLDESGAPLSDVSVQFSMRDRYDGPIAQVKSHICSFAQQVRTDSNGYFQTKRIAREILHDLELAPARMDFLSHGWLPVSNVVNGVEQLLAQNFILTLKRGLAVRGKVVDAFNNPVPDIQVTFGSYYSNQRRATSALSGDFVLKGCTAGSNIISAFSYRHGAGFEVINVTSNTEPVLLKMQPFRTLNVRTVDSAGAPVPKVQVTWQSVDESGKTSNDFPGRPTPQYSFSGFTDENGELIWTYAPADRVIVSFYPNHHGQRHNLLLDADGLVQTVTLEENYPPQMISGTVRDSVTGQPIPAIRVRKGYPRTRNGVVTPVWYTSWSDILDFAGGSYKLQFDYTVDEPPSRSEYMFEFSAHGYEPFVSRVIRGDEGNVELDVSLNRESD
ncbi:MAG TPA: sigma-70 family RNA polymerase sigma factor [Verrucomicrobiae bacterium]